MLATRNRKQIKKYKKYSKDLPVGSCQFCEIDQKDSQFVTETKSFKIIRNIFPYNYWDLHRVEDHLMIVPKKHTDTLNDLNAQEAVEYVNVIGSYESRGYNVYSRAPLAGMKTVVHQHTHLIKLAGRPKRLLIYTKNKFLRMVV